MIQYLNDLLDLDLILNTNNYIELSLKDKEKFKLNFNNIVTNLKSGKPILDNHLFEKNIMESMIIFFVNNYSYKNLIKNKYTNKFIIELDKNEAKDESINNFYNNNINDVIDVLENIDISHLWGYLKETLESFKKTFYGRKLIDKKEKYKINNFYNFKDKVLNLKNIYNICKNLMNVNILYKNKSEYVKKPKIYSALESDEKISFWDNLLSSNNFSWIKIKSNLAKQYGSNLSNSEYRSIRNKIGMDFNKLNSNGKQFWFDLVFNELVQNGLISEFLPNENLTNLNKLPSNFMERSRKVWKRLKRQIDSDRENLNNSYYYLNNSKFGDIEVKIKGKKVKYLDLITSKEGSQLWYTFYAMDWISQINFFHHYINHQIIYVTGSTGTGKSTQVPKLLLYGLKMFDCKYDGKIICTQPRINPTVENTQRISLETGFPIEYNNLKLSNYNLQYKHSKGQHINDHFNDLQLRMVTDGTLLEEIINNSIMKEQFPSGKYVNGKAEYNIGLKNKYDIMIVDEAHEHNTNMDLILTLARNSCVYNNSVRLVIISATMDDDEPIYRNYFKLINDKILFPIKYDTLHPIIMNNEMFNLYQIYMDRRLHISPPGGTTLFKIDDIYINNIKYTGDDKKDSIISQNESYKIIQNICKQNDTGQILLFSTGQAEILKAVEYLNNNLPPGNIALPFFTSLNYKYKAMMQKIDTKVKDITNNRKNIHKEWNDEYKEIKSVPKGTYKRAIIVATNVAEASITISGLKYVIDTGYAKVNYFNELLDSSQLVVEKISEASRIQRRGRVGRISSGTVYYMYPKGDRENIKPNGPNIC